LIRILWLSKTQQLMRYISYGVMVYMLAALTWWAILLSRYNTETFLLKKEIIENSKVDNPVETSAQKLENAQLRYQKNKKMILSEGLVIGLSLILGLYFIQKSYNSEIDNTKRQKNFLLSITHELKSPIAAIKLNIETLIKRHQLPPEQKHQLYGDIYTENQRLEKLINNLLLASRMDNAYPYNFEKININTVIQDVKNHVSAQFPSIEIMVTNIAEEQKIPIDKEAMYSLIYNLVENAAKYTPKNKGKVNINIVLQTPNIVITVTDNGVGIPETEKLKVFEQFYRIGQEETRSTKGTGLGLYISSKIAMAHQGKLSLTDNKPSGCVFTVTLPLNRK
jgi:signal transduction histidine kinase